MLSRVLDLWETSGAAEAAEHSSKQHSETERWSRAVRRSFFFSVPHNAPLPDHENSFTRHVLPM